VPDTDTADAILPLIAERGGAERFDAAALCIAGMPASCCLTRSNLLHYGSPACRALPPTLASLPDESAPQYWLRRAQCSPVITLIS